MTHTSRTRIAALLAVLAIATAACSTASADDTPDTTPTTQVPADETPVQDEPMQDPGPDAETTYPPIEVEGDLAGDGFVPGDGTLISVDGNTVTVGFWMGVEDCYGIERIDIAETETKVTVDVTIAERDLDQVCISLAEARSVTVELDAPLGGRILEFGGAPVNG